MYSDVRKRIITNVDVHRVHETIDQRTLVSSKQLSVEQSARLLFRRLSGKQTAHVAHQREECLDLENLLLF